MGASNLAIGVGRLILQQPIAIRGGLGVDGDAENIALKKRASS